jgi:NADH-quinone oxidoreductase subunit N
MTAVAIYLLVYTFANAGAFALVVMLHRQGEVGERVEDFAGLARTRPAAAAAMLIFLLSLAGIPATAGFIGKWWLFGAAIRMGGGFVWLAVVAVLNSVISLYYYARIVMAMYMSEPDGDEKPAMPLALTSVIGLAAVFTLVIGLYPQPFIRLAQIAFLPLGGI